MLVLQLTEGERVLIGDSIVVALCEKRNGQTRIGISAPKEIQIIRAELAPHWRRGKPPDLSGNRPQ